MKEEKSHVIMTTKKRERKNEKLYKIRGVEKGIFEIVKFNFTRIINIMDKYQGSYQNSDVEFHRLSNSIGSNIQKILQNVSSMQRMIAQIGTSQENQQLQNQL
ncbi:STX7 [Lepeophtheirus salmonis]|uniref:STX7 n=1 Tax=Lepeophtheirus salmonis TaxID=72036 RepID=A0A7R8CUF9_LEPSM|nr:STX7 [Lepeophtheirus salmonis]CAF2884607.1 STX7 [Lepeophtheirus salmonis]